MALTKDKKSDVVKEVAELLTSAKMTVAAKYQGTTVKAMQQLRRDARDNGTVVKVVKNRLVIKALQQHPTFKDTDVSQLNSMLVYAFNSEDEVAPAQILATFAKTNPTIEFVGAFTAEGVFIDAAEVKALAALPSKPQLIAGVINTLQSPVRGVMSSLSGNLHGLLQALEAKADK
jgi:large subunit ribosomal protein L10